MNREELFAQILKKGSFLSIGLDTDVRKIPEGLTQLEFNKKIIDATHDLCVVYKLNLAFYESEGLEGWFAFEKTVEYIRENYPEIFIIADAKRGDIGNTSNMYARAFFEKMNVDAVTVAPYMGEDSVSPFLYHKDKWAIVLALTSNKGAEDFQQRYVECDGTTEFAHEYLYESVLLTSQKWGTPDNMMYVIGATKAESLQQIRQLVPDHFLLVPGVGAQGGSLQEVARHGMNMQCGLLVNSSRQIIYASAGEDFAERARYEAYNVRLEMTSLLVEHGF